MRTYKRRDCRFSSEMSFSRFTVHTYVGSDIPVRMFFVGVGIAEASRLHHRLHYGASSAR